MHAPRVGVLSLQGDFARHGAMLNALGVEHVAVRLPEHLAALDALVLPGGESTTMLRLMAENGLRRPLERFVASKPVLGTCAGLILLGSAATPLPHPPLAVLDVSVERNAYGRQIDSFSAPVRVIGRRRTFPGVFIRAPRIGRRGASVEAVAHLLDLAGGDAEIVGVRQGRAVGLCFHPELSGDPFIHTWFLEHVAEFTLPAVRDALSEAV